MQSLPDIAPERRAEAAKRYLAGAAADFAEAEQKDIVLKVLAILDEQKFAQIFAPGSRAEVPIVGRIARAGAATIKVSGQADRLAMTADAILIADYKTDRAVPRGPEDAPAPYVGQLALYRAVLSRLYPNKTVRAALLFTQEPCLLEISAEAMDKALAALPSAET